MDPVNACPVSRERLMALLEVYVSPDVFGVVVQSGGALVEQAVRHLAVKEAAELSLRQVHTEKLDACGLWLGSNAAVAPLCSVLSGVPVRLDASSSCHRK